MLALNLLKLLWNVFLISLSLPVFNIRSLSILVWNLVLIVQLLVWNLQPILLLHVVLLINAITVRIQDRSWDICRLRQVFLAGWNDLLVSGVLSGSWGYSHRLLESKILWCFINFLRHFLLIFQALLGFFQLLIR